MSAILLVFNFVLILLAFYLILHLYQSIRLLQKTNTEEIAKEIESVFQVYLEDTRTDNRKLLAEISKLVQSNSQSSRRKTAKKKPRPAVATQTDTSSNKSDQAFEDILAETVEKPAATHAVDKEEAPSIDWMPPIEQIKDTLDESPELQALRLQNQGLTSAEIAKQLGRGEGEVLLLLKMQNRERGTQS
ncbi:MAG: hypothetical protein ABF608_05550 [Sporolactobacillus sp.]